MPAGTPRSAGVSVGAGAGRKRRREREVASSSSSDASSSSSSSASGSKRRRRDRRKEKKLRRQEEKRRRKEEKERRRAEKDAAKDAAFAGKIRKGVQKILEGNEALDKGRPLTLVRAAVVSVAALIAAARKDPQTASVIMDGDQRLKYLKTVNYGVELLLRCGWREGDEDGDDEAERYYALRDRHHHLLHLADAPLREAVAKVDEMMVERAGQLRAECISAAGKLAGLDEVSSKAAGVALGACCGDVLGLPVANWRGDVIKRWFNSISEFHGLLPARRGSLGPTEHYWSTLKPKHSLGVYSGEWAVAVSIGVSVLERGRLDSKAAAKRVVDDHAAYAGYGRHRMSNESIRVQIGHLSAGADYRSTGLCLNPEGLRGCDAPAIVTLVALAYRDQGDEGLIAAVKGALLPFVVHPDGIGAAYVYAHALRHLMERPSPASAAEGREAALGLVDHLRAKTAQLNMSDHLKRSLASLFGVLSRKVTQAEFAEVVADDGDEGEDSETTFTSAVGALSGALLAFTTHITDPVAAVSAAVGLGEASSVLGLLCGALCGAAHGCGWVPCSWYSMLENGDGSSVPGVGRDRFVDIAVDCARLTPQKVKGLEDPVPFQQKRYKYRKREAGAAAAEQYDRNAAPVTGVSAMPISMRKFAPEGVAGKVTT
eukprot:TRINITY_DN12701_c0_g1_i1.p1 TRINITY_DN12701_c0_g1~~TRINITY_DN12701_c0_g1_i1.p1  ORF type:complete len:657 (+),score=197.32 TRINITY_DN12701_c0_g1_i1:101-2071(+)